MIVQLWVGVGGFAGWIEPASAADVAAPATTARSKSEEARECLAAGVNARKRGQDHEAVGWFERALELDATPEAMAQAALAEQALGRWLKAHDRLVEALSESSDPWIAEHADVLRSALQEIESHLGRLEVTCNVPGAEVRVDGYLIGVTPLASTRYVLAGQGVVEVSAPGFFSVARQVQVDVGSLSRVEVHLVRIQAGSGEFGSPQVGPRKPVVGSTEHPRRVWAYASFGVAALGAGVGLAGSILREVNVRRYNDDSRCAVKLGIERSAECPAQVASARQGEALAIAGYSAALLFGGAGLYLLLKSAPFQTTEPVNRAQPSNKADTTTGGWTCRIGTSMVACARRF
ncbi:MAG TPA: PEGA domain-containing protein [Polyangiaceae bacterium]|nr:PEGA domain-containing protein [Polyangiaceae bacterium]